MAGVTNTLAYNTAMIITIVKSFVAKVPGQKRIQKIFKAAEAKPTKLWKGKFRANLQVRQQFA